MKKLNTQATGLAIKQKCEQFGYDQKELSRLFDVTLTTPYLWFSGSVLPRIEYLASLCDLCNCKFEDLLVFDDDTDDGGIREDGQ